MTKENILENFLFYATEHGYALWNGDHKKANEMHQALQSLYKAAKETNIPDVFSECLDEEDANVRFWAATFTLKVKPDIAEKELLNLSQLKGITALNASTTLKIWNQGFLNLL